MKLTEPRARIIAAVITGIFALAAAYMAIAPYLFGSPNRSSSLLPTLTATAPPTLTATAPPKLTVTALSSPHVNILILDERGNPVESANILLIAKNTTYLEGETGSDGKTVIPYSTKGLFTVFCAHKEFSAYMKRDFDPSNGFLLIQLSRLSNVGSCIFPDSSGSIPNLEGWLNPILDSSQRLYLYATNMAINGGQHQPVDFKMNEPVEITDRNGKTVLVKFIEVIGRSWLVEFEDEGKKNP